MKRRRHSESKHAQRYFACQTLARGEAGTCPWPFRPGDILTSIGPVRQPCVLCRLHEELMRIWEVAENEEAKALHKSRIDWRTEYEKLAALTPAKRGWRHDWCFEIYEEAGRDIERAVELLPVSHCEPEDVPLFEVILRMMETRVGDQGMRLWWEMMDAVYARHGVAWRNGPASMAERIRTLPDVYLTRSLDDARNDPREEEAVYRALLEAEYWRRGLSPESMAPEYLEAAE